jgi:hypothetical protein
VVTVVVVVDTLGVFRLDGIACESKKMKAPDE